ncbi:MAG: hypothetical protein RL654_666 [Pseudomonadota bacterium]|jgi:diguanylate cyclase (GGDEF)-like protein/PAS domain S-box-containing protein
MTTGLDALPCAVLVTDGQGVLQALNAELLTWVGGQAADWLGRRIDPMLVPASRIFLQTHVWPMLLRQQRVQELQLVLRGAAGARMPVLLNVRLAQQASDPAGLRFTWVLFPARERQRFEAELLQARQRLQHLVESTDAGTWEWNVQTGELRLNERGWRILGLAPGQSWPARIDQRFRLERAHPAERVRTLRRLMCHVAGRRDAHVDEVRLRRLDGGWVWVQERGQVISRTPDGRPEWVFGTHIDIDPIKRQQEALRLSKTLLDRTNELAGVGGWAVDLHDPLQPRLYWSEQTCRIHGVPPGHQPALEEAIGFFLPEHRPCIETAVQRGIAEGRGWDLELQLRRCDGTVLWVRALGQVEFEQGRVVRLIGAVQDISERVRERAELHQLAGQLAEQHERLRVTLHSIGDAVITTDVEGRVTWLNPVAERLTGWLQAEAAARPLMQVFHAVDEHDRRPLPDPVVSSLSDGLAGVAEPGVPRLISRDGSEAGIEISAAAIRDTQGRVHGAVLVFRDVTEQRRMAGEMSHRASHDALTGLINRMEFEARLERMLLRAQSESSHHALLFIDLDQFKLVNDACGHAAGDLLLQQVSRLMRQTVRSRDTLARLGGDEFAVVLEHCDEAQAQRVAHLICERFDAFRFIHDERRFRVGASIGLVPLDRRWRSITALMQAADVSCYAAKEAGRNRVHVWFDSDQAVRQRHGEMRWASRLEQALDEDRFVLHAQRILPCQPEPAGAPQTLHAEVLVRLRESDGQLVAPGAFLPAAERFHMASRIDRRVLQLSLQALGRRPAASPAWLLSVNLSGQSIGDRHFCQEVLEMLERAGPLACRQLCLEITETAAIGSMSEAARFTSQVRERGVQVALDDFGAGASSFGYLKHLTVDWLKIDGQFVRDLLDDPLDEAAVRSFVDVARVMALATVAEFVEHPEVLRRLQAMGVGRAQGFLLHQPEPLENLLDSPLEMKESGRHET